MSLPRRAARAAAGPTLRQLPASAVRPGLLLLPSQPSAGVGQVKCVGLCGGLSRLVGGTRGLFWGLVFAMRVFLDFVIIQRSWACFTWASAPSPLPFLLLLLLFLSFRRRRRPPPPSPLPFSFVIEPELGWGRGWVGAPSHACDRFAAILAVTFHL